MLDLYESQVSDQTADLKHNTSLTKRRYYCSQGECHLTPRCKLTVST